MQPRLTENEYNELQRLLQIIRDETKLPNQRRIAMAKFDLIYNEALRRTRRENMLEYA